MNAETQLRIVRRGTQWIATHFDKRDDDLVAFDSASLVDGTGNALPVTLAKGGRTVNVTFGPNVLREGPPSVDGATFTWTGDPATPVTIRLTQPVEVFRVRLAALEGTQVVNLMDVEFARNFVSGGSIATYRWAPTPTQLSLLARYCTADLAAAHGTSLWLEGVVGHVGVPDEMAFVGAPPAPSATHLWQAVRRPDGSWLPKADMVAPLGLPGRVVAAAATSAAAGESQFLLATLGGGLWHTMRHPAGTWDRVGDVKGAIGPVDAPIAVSAVSCAPGEAQFIVASQDGALWHTMRHPNGAWDHAGDVRGQIGQIGRVVAVTAASPAAGEAWFCVATDTGRLWQTTRHINGSWLAATDLTSTIGDTGPVTAVAATRTATGELQLMVTTRDGGLWHALRHPTGVWDRLGDVRGQIGNRGSAFAVTAVSSAAGEAQFLFATREGGVWHTIRHPNGGWDAAGDVQGQLGSMGPLAAVSADSATLGEVQFLLG